MAIVKNRIIAYKELARVHFMQGFQKHTPRPVLCYGLPLVINTISKSFIVQWGAGSSTPADITLPTSFTGHYSPIACQDTRTSIYQNICTYQPNASGFKIAYADLTNNVPFHWIAIGL